MNRKYRALLIVALALPLAGCWKEQQEAIAKCTAAHPYTGRYAPLAHIQTPMSECMSQAGYYVDYDSSRCLNIAIPRRSPYCYAPKGWLARIGFRIEMTYQPGPTAPHPPQS